jgi:hypothetical protein
MVSSLLPKGGKEEHTGGDGRCDLWAVFFCFFLGKKPALQTIVKAEHGRQAGKARWSGVCVGGGSVS